MGNERDLSKRVRESLRLAGCACYPVETGGTSVGFPDLVVLHKGGASFVELKSRPGVMLSSLASRPLEGPGQKAFARRLASLSSFCSQGCRVSEHSFLFAECMDGYALLAEEKQGSWLAACWESFPEGDDLRDTLRAWRVRVMPLAEMTGRSIGWCYEACAKAYLGCTGIGVSLAGIVGEESPLACKEKAEEIARDICDMGRLALLLGSMKRETAGAFEED